MKQQQLSPVQIRKVQEAIVGFLRLIITFGFVVYVSIVKSADTAVVGIFVALLIGTYLANGAIHWTVNQDKPHQD